MMEFRTEKALRAAIIEKPDDDFLRLLYADWAEENGFQTYASFIRLQLEHAKMERPKVINDGDYVNYCEGCLRDMGICEWHRVKRDMRGILEDRPNGGATNVWAWRNGWPGEDWPVADKEDVCIGFRRVEFHRGFVRRVEGVNSYQWVELGHKVIEVQPIGSVLSAHEPHVNVLDGTMARAIFQLMDGSGNENLMNSIHPVVFEAIDLREDRLAWNGVTKMKYAQEDGTHPEGMYEVSVRCSCKAKAALEDALLHVGRGLIAKRRYLDVQSRVRFVVND